MFWSSRKAVYDAKLTPLINRNTIHSVEHGGGSIMVDCVMFTGDTNQKSISILGCKARNN